MGIEHVEFLDDRVRVKYHCRTPDFCPDVDATKEILYSGIDQLQPLPKGESGEEVRIPGSDRTIVFVFDIHQERSAGNCMDESFQGVYRKPVTIDDYLPKETRFNPSAHEIPEGELRAYVFSHLGSDDGCHTLGGGIVDMIFLARDLNSAKKLYVDHKYKSLTYIKDQQLKKIDELPLKEGLLKEVVYIEDQL